MILLTADQVIDLSVATAASPSEATPVDIAVLDHERGAAVLGLAAEDFVDGFAISNETVTLTTHTGTHMDAPLHYGPRTADRPARSIEEVPLEWCIGRGVRLDLRHVQARAGIGAADLGAALAAAEHELAAADIVLLWTGSDRLWGSPDYRTSYPGLTEDGTAFLVEQGVRVIGIDAWGLDRPAAAMIDDYRRTGEKQILWPAHVYGRRNEYLQLEKLAGLDRLPAATGFVVVCFPVAIAGAGAGWTRVVALLDGPPGDDRAADS